MRPTTDTPAALKSTAQFYERVKSVIPDVEWPVHAPYVAAINELKQSRNAVILAHNYQTPEIFHCVADITGEASICLKSGSQSLLLFTSQGELVVTGAPWKRIVSSSIQQ